MGVPDHAAPFSSSDALLLFPSPCACDILNFGSAFRTASLPSHPPSPMPGTSLCSSPPALFMGASPCNAARTGDRRQEPWWPARGAAASGEEELTGSFPAPGGPPQRVAGAHAAEDAGGAEVQVRSARGLFWGPGGPVWGPPRREGPVLGPWGGPCGGLPLRGRVWPGRRCRGRCGRTGSGGVVFPSSREDLLLPPRRSRRVCLARGGSPATRRCLCCHAG